MEQYVYLIRSARNNFLQTMTPEEEAVMGEHFNYLKDMLDKNQLIMAGPCLDGAFGIVVFESESLDSATEFMHNDPAVKSGVMSGELHPYRASLLRNN